MNDEVRKEIKQMLAPLVAGLVLLACMQIASLFVFVRTDLFRKEQNKAINTKVGENTAAIFNTASAVKAEAEAAHEERVRFQAMERQEQAGIRKALEEMNGDAP